MGGIEYDNGDNGGDAADYGDDDVQHVLLTTVQYSIVQCSTVQYSTVKCSTVQCDSL